jgi:hypothetical protein
MTDPARLLDGSLDLESRRAIEAAVRDEPPRGAKARLWGSLAVALPAGVLLGATTSTTATAAAAATNGVAAGGTAATVASAATTASTGTAALGTTATVVGSTGLGLLAGKAVAIGLGVGLAINVAGGVATRVLDSKPAASMMATAQAPTAAKGHSPSQSRQQSPAPSGFPVQVLEAELPAVAVRGTSSTTKPPVPEELTADELREESALLVRTREALTASRAARALDLIAEHRQRFQGGRLVQERDALEVQALVKAGQMTAAKARAQAFLARYPESPHGEKVRAIVGAVGQP